MSFLKFLYLMRRKSASVFPAPELAYEGQEVTWPCALIWLIFQGAATLIGTSWYRRPRLSTDPEQRLRQLWKKKKRKVLSTAQWINNSNEKEKTQRRRETKERGRCLSQGGERRQGEWEEGEPSAPVGREGQGTPGHTYAELVGRKDKAKGGNPSPRQVEDD